MLYKSALTGTNVSGKRGFVAKKVGASRMADPKLGTKQVCPSCEAKFYDLNRRPAVCPKCHYGFDPADEVVQATKTKIRAKAAEDAVPDDEDEDEELESENVSKAVTDDDDEDTEETAKELGGDEDDVPLDMGGDEASDEDVGMSKVPAGFSEEGVDSDEDDDLLDTDDDDFDIDDDDLDIDDDGNLDDASSDGLGDREN